MMVVVIMSETTYCAETSSMLRLYCRSRLRFLLSEGFGKLHPATRVEQRSSANRADRRCEEIIVVGVNDDVGETNVKASFYDTSDTNRREKILRFGLRFLFPVGFSVILGRASRSVTCSGLLIHFSCRNLVCPTHLTDLYAGSFVFGFVTPVHEKN